MTPTAKQKIGYVADIFGGTFLKWVMPLNTSGSDKASYMHGLRSMCNAYINGTMSIHSLIEEANIYSSYFSNKYGESAKPFVDRIEWFIALLELELEEERMAG